MPGHLGEQRHAHSEQCLCGVVTLKRCIYDCGKKSIRSGTQNGLFFHLVSFTWKKVGGYGSGNDCLGYEKVGMETWKVTFPL